MFLDDVYAANQFGDRMLDLHPGVHFNEIELAVLIQELESSRAAIANPLAGVHAHLTDPATLLRGNAGSGRFFNDLLVAALHGTVAFAEMNGVTVGIGQHLNFNVTRMLQVLFHVHGRVAEGRLRLAAGQIEGGQQRRLAMHDPHPAPAAAAGRLNDDWVADLVGDPQRFLGVVADRSIGAGDAGDAGLLHRSDR